MLNKKIVSGLAILSMVGILAGCGSAPTAKKDEPAKAVQKASDDKSQDSAKVNSDVDTNDQANQTDQLSFEPSTNQAKKNTFERFTAKTIDGKKVDQSILKGHKLTVINFWGTFCPPCIHEMPFLGQLAKVYDPSEVQFIGVPVDTLQGDEPNYVGEIINKAKAILSQSKADFTQILPSGDLMDAYIVDHVSSLPTTVFVDDKGTIVEEYLGGRDMNNWKSLIDEALKKVK